MRASLHFAKRMFGRRSNIVGVEVGVASGDNSRNILLEWDIEKLYGVEIVPEEVEITKKFMESFGNYEIICGDSVEVSKQFTNEFFDFVYLDDDHSTFGVSRSLEAWYPKVKHGGIIAGHDYYPDCSDESGVFKGVIDFFVRTGLILNAEDTDFWGVKP